jgi:uncharacterized DUF497 family protein
LPAAQFEYNLAENLRRGAAWPRFTRPLKGSAGWSRANTQHARPLRASARAGAVYLRYNHQHNTAMELRFEWDNRKAKSNQRKHGVSFVEAQSVFYDENARLIPDDEHSADEDRFVLLGLSRQLRVLIVCHCYRQDNEVIRIISARRASQDEAQHYRDFIS